MMKKARKSRILASQNLRKTLPNSVALLAAPGVSNIIALARLLVVFFAFWCAHGSILEGPGWLRAGFWSHRNFIFRRFSVHARLRCPNAPNVAKLQFLQGFCMVFTHRELGAQATKRRKISPKACRTQLPAEIVLKTRLGEHFWTIWRSLGRQLASFCSLLAGC